MAALRRGARAFPGDREGDGFRVIEDFAEADCDRGDVGELVCGSLDHLLPLRVGEPVGWPSDEGSDVEAVGVCHVQVVECRELVTCLPGEVADFGVVAHETCQYRVARRAGGWPHRAGWERSPCQQPARARKATWLEAGKHPKAPSR
jgi:hypothetical protein